MSKIKSILLAATALVVTTQCQAAEFSWWNSGQERIVKIDGDIVAGDAAKFDRYIAGSTPDYVMSHVTVLLSSKGGDPYEAIVIGQTIRNYQYRTFVKSGVYCASACGFIWLAGVPRGIEVLDGQGPYIGFHGVYKMIDGNSSSSGNAVVGSYLGHLGFSYSAIQYFTQAPSDSMEWLTEAKAQSLYLEYQECDKQTCRRWKPSR